MQQRRKEIWKEVGLNPNNYSLTVGQAMEQYAIEYHEQQVKNLNIPAVSGSVCECKENRKVPYVLRPNLTCKLCQKPLAN